MRVLTVWMWELAIKKAEHWRIDGFELWCWRRLLRVPRTAGRSNQSILKEISPEYSLKSLMLKLNSNTLATWCEELTHSKRLWCWERLKEDGRKRGWQRMKWLDGSPTQWTWVWASSKRWWRTGKPGMLQYTGLQKVGHDWVTEQEQRMPSAVMRINLAIVIPGDVSETEKDINYMILLICRI